MLNELALIRTKAVKEQRLHDAQLRLVYKGTAFTDRQKTTKQEFGDHWNG